MGTSVNQVEIPQLVEPPAAFVSGDFGILKPLERIAFRLAVGLFTIITAVLITIMIDWLIHRPELPSLSNLKLEDQKTAIDNFKAMSDVVWDRTSKTFDLIVVKALLPVFATVVGFLLGKREA